MSGSEWEEGVCKGGMCEKRPCGHEYGVRYKCMRECMQKGCVSEGCVRNDVCVRDVCVRMCV